VIGVVFLAAAFGQEGLSTLRGTVTDTSGAVVPGVEVVAREVLTNVTARTAKTDAQGNYEMPGLKAGKYQLTATLTGFKKSVIEDVALQSNQVRRVEIALQIGEIATEVTVSERATAIQTEQGKIGADFQAAQRYQDLPVPGNAFSGTYAVLSILPDVQRRSGTGSSGGAPTFAGQYGNQVHMSQDGVKEETLNSQTVNMEAVAELKAVAVNNTAEYARPGYFDAVTKSGTNEYHVEASYYHRNSALGARSFFQSKKPQIIYHTFNLSGSGPIVKNKTFVYALWNGERVPGSTFYLSTVPTALMRSGNFSEFLPLARPVTVKDPLTGQPFPGNVIPAGRIAGVAQKVQESFLPPPNRQGLANNLGWLFPYPSDQFYADVFSVRLDHSLSQNNSFFGRIQTYFPKYVNAGTYPELASTQLRPNYAWVFTDTHVFSPNLVNTFSTGGNRDALSYGKEVDGHKPGLASDIVKMIGLQGVNRQGLTPGGGSPVFSIAGYSEISVRAGGFYLADQNFNFGDSVSWAHGRHVIKIGGEQRTYSRFDARVPNENFGGFSFNGNWSGNAYADFLLGLPWTSMRLNPLVNRKQTSKELGIFVTDTFKVTPKLTLDVGVRWDRFSASTFDDGLMFNWDLKTGNVLVPQEAMSKVIPLYPKTITVAAGQVVPDPDKRNFAPRIGVAYRLNDKTAIRGGYGIFNEFMGKYVRLNTGGPYALTETYNNTITNGVPLFQMPNPFPSAAVSASVPSQSVTGYPNQTVNGLIHQFNVTVERQVGDLGFRISYIGSRNRDQNYSLSINKPQPSLTPFTASRRPYSQFTGASFFRADGGANYDSMSAEANRRVGMVTFNAHWTWAHGMSNFLNLENPYNSIVWNRDFFAKHRVVFNTVWELPFGRGRKFLNQLPGPAEQILGGWRFVWLAYFQTGQYFSPSFSGSDPSNTNTSGGLPDRICNGNLPPDQRKVNRWFDTSCFAVPPAGRFGNSGMNILEGPGMHVHNVTLLKEFRLSERLRFDYMAMFSNILNHPNFMIPASNISAPGQAGTISLTPDIYSGERAGPRMIEMRVRLRF
jgi:hypothetical protein